MFKFSEHPPALKWTYFVVFCLVLWRQAHTLLAPWMGYDLPFAFRSDNFFSFSGGQIRRGLIGEKLILIQSWGLDAILLYSIFLLAFFVFLYAYIFPKLLQTFKVSEVILILLSGFFLMPGLDREMFLLLPAIYFFLRRKFDFLFYVFLAITAFVHELSLLLYFPFIWDLALRVWKEKRLLPMSYLLLITSSFGAVVLLKSELNLIPEKSFWPQYGISGLEDHFLYTFAGKGLGATLKLHASVILGKVQSLYAIPGLLAFFVLVTLTLKRFGAAGISIYYFVAINILLFLLTIDYGRYFYLLFFFYLLLSQTGLLNRADKALSSFKFLLPKFIARVLAFNFSYSWYFMALLIFALAPFGYWLGDTLIEPALWQEVKQIINFQLPKYAGE